VSRLVILVALLAACGGDDPDDDPCVEEAELTPCHWNGAVGVCSGGVCTASDCGNLEVEPGEECDDGNHVNGDGCRSDCSAPVCADGIKDPFEGCDDGNRRDHDGCSHDCRRELDVWRLVERHPSPRSNAAIAYDPARGVAVMYGGAGAAGEVHGDTWEWDGAHWNHIPLLFTGPPRQGAKMVFDPRLGSMLLVGGEPGHWISTWQYDGTSWLGRDMGNDDVSPGTGHAVAWSGARDTVVLVGGVGESFGGVSLVYALATFGAIPDEWRQLFPRPPRAMIDHAIVEDPVRGELIVFSGRTDDPGSAAVDDAWVFGANGWTALPSSGAPTLGATGVFDPVLGRALFYDGTKLTAWNGSAWSTIDAPNAPSPRRGAAVTYDLRRHELVVFGGVRDDGVTSDETFTFDGSWRRHEPPPPVITLGGATAAWDAARGAGLVVGAKTWRWTGALEEVADAGPGPRTRPALAALRDRLVLTGGAAATDTWAWSGSWQPIAASGAPGLAASVMAADRQGLVLAGGGETWTFRDAQWARTGQSAPAASELSLAYDPLRMRTIANGRTNTAEWDGSSWSASPSSIQAGALAMTYDASRRTVLALGESGVFEYRAQQWTPLTFAGSKPSAPPAAIFHDPIRRAVIYLEDSSPVRAWAFRYDNPARDSCSPALDNDRDGLQGCADPDCWALCTPFCPPGTTCDASLPRCGDGVCNSVLESCDLCPADCQCPTLCGDYRCDQGEQCPGDC